jgi:stage V sporulation protein D (sporulation-specific penicillin-binding protein)
MWRDQKKTTSNRQGDNNNRLRLVAAIIFLLTGALIYRLYHVQINQSDLYTAMAASQHEISSKLIPDRGKVIIADSAGGESSQYTLATNKDFYLIYGIPKDVVNPGEVANNLYDFFDKPFISKTLDTTITNSIQDDFETRLSAINNDDSLSPEDKQKKLAEEIKRQVDLKNSGTIEQQKEAQISTQQLDIVNNYIKKLSRVGGMYAIIQNKVSDDKLLEFYAFMNNKSTTTQIDVKDLSISLGKVMNSKTGKQVKLTGFDFEIKKFRYYPETNIASHLLGFVSYADETGSGRYGLEEFFNEELTGKLGSLKGERGVNNAVIVNDREYVKPVTGSDLVLTIDRSVEFYACEQLKKTVDKFQAKGGTVIALDAKTGAVLAMCSVPDFDPNNYKDVSNIAVFNNPAVFEQYEPGSVFKTITMSIALDQNKVTPNTTYTDPGEIYINGWSKPIRNSDFDTKGGHGLVDMNFVLENSLNTGAIFAMRQAGAKTFAEYVKNFGFGEKTGIELGSESPGNINNLLKKNIKEIDAAVASFGQGITVTPLQMISAYQVFANHGYLMKPYIVKEIRHPDGKVDNIAPVQERRVVSDKTATTILGMLANVVTSGHSKKAAIPGYYIGGKTGTAQIAVNGSYAKDRYNHTFIGIAPIDNPKFVMLTHIDSPKGIQYAEASALPLWTDIATFMLQYYQVPKTK